jgi:hypothetical protein
MTRDHLISQHSKRRLLSEEAFGANRKRQPSRKDGGKSPEFLDVSK